MSNAIIELVNSIESKTSAEDWELEEQDGKTTITEVMHAPDRGPIRITTSGKENYEVNCPTKDKDNQPELRHWITQTDEERTIVKPFFDKVVESKRSKSNKTPTL